MVNVLCTKPINKYIKKKKKQQVYRDDTRSRVTVYDWIQLIKNGRESLENDISMGQPFTLTAE
jgi:hypothetical protein